MTAPEDNLEEFNDPVNYDLEEIPGSTQRIEFIRGLFRGSGLGVLDLACGTGLATLPLAQDGHRCTGVDLSPPMLAHAQAKAVALGVAARCRWILGDVRRIRLPPLQGHVVLTGNAFQAMLREPDQRALLATVRHHLAPGGRFVFETRNPEGHDLSDIAHWEHWFDYVNARGEAVQVGGMQKWHARRKVLEWTTERRWVDGRRGVQVSTRTRISCRFTDADTLAGLLADGGLRIVSQYGDWDRSPLAPTSPLIVTVCEPA